MHTSLESHASNDQVYNTAGSMSIPPRDENARKTIKEKERRKTQSDMAESDLHNVAAQTDWCQPNRETMFVVLQVELNPAPNTRCHHFTITGQL